MTRMYEETDAAGKALRIRDAVARASVVILLALSALHLGWGFLQLVAGPPPNAAIDLRYRWLETGYFLQRQNPLDVVAASAAPRTETDDKVRIDPDLGPLTLDMPAYPPWSYVTGLLTAPRLPF